MNYLRYISNRRNVGTTFLQLPNFCVPNSKTIKVEIWNITKGIHAYLVYFSDWLTDLVGVSSIQVEVKIDESFILPTIQMMRSMDLNEIFKQYAHSFYGKDF